MKLLIFLNQSVNTITKLKTIRNHRFSAAFAELFVNAFKTIKTHNEKWVLL